MCMHVCVYISIPFQLPYHPKVALAARLINGLGTTLACAPIGCMHTDFCSRSSHPVVISMYAVLFYVFFSLYFVMLLSSLLGSFVSFVRFPLFVRYVLFVDVEEHLQPQAQPDVRVPIYIYIYIYTHTYVYTY